MNTSSEVKYAIRFDWPEGSLYAGFHNGAAGWAPTLDTAILCDSEEEAQRWIDNGYGEAGKKYGKVITCSP